ncbi:hypothetical protein FKP32DRAFT_289775 [Trametes sanguinea]|nr:hypothetical protein FKP32DRAFT_289775 [Trametes sanguinea]
MALNAVSGSLALLHYCISPTLRQSQHAHRHAPADALDGTRGCRTECSPRHRVSSRARRGGRRARPVGHCSSRLRLSDVHEPRGTRMGTSRETDQKGRQRSSYVRAVFRRPLSSRARPPAARRAYARQTQILPWIAGLSPRERPALRIIIYLLAPLSFLHSDALRRTLLGWRLDDIVLYPPRWPGVPVEPGATYHGPYHAQVITTFIRTTITIDPQWRGAYNDLHQRCLRTVAAHPCAAR